MESHTFVASADRGAGLVRPKCGYLLLAAATTRVPAIAMVGGAPLVLVATMIVNALLFGGMALRYGRASTRAPDVQPGELRVDASGQLLFGRSGKTRVLARKGELTQGLLAPADGAVLVRLERKGPASPRTGPRTRWRRRSRTCRRRSADVSSCPRRRRSSSR